MYGPDDILLILKCFNKRVWVWEFEFEIVELYQSSDSWVDNIVRNVSGSHAEIIELDVELELIRMLQYIVRYH